MRGRCGRAKWIRPRAQCGGLAKGTHTCCLGGLAERRGAAPQRGRLSKRCILRRLGKGRRRSRRGAKRVGLLAQCRGLAKGTGLGRGTKRIRRGRLLEGIRGAPEGVCGSGSLSRRGGGALADVDAVRMRLFAVDDELDSGGYVAEGVLDLLLGVLVQGLDVGELQSQSVSQQQPSARFLGN